MYKLLTGIFLTGFLTAEVPAREVNVGYFHAPPHIYEQAGKMHGPLYLMLQDIFAGEAITLNFQKLNLSRMLLELERGEVAFTPLLIKNAERDERYLFAPQPFFESYPAMIVPRSFSRKVRQPEDLQNLQLYGIQGAAHSPFIQKAGVKIQYISGHNKTQRAVQMVARERIEALYIPGMFAARKMVSQLALDNELKVLQLPGKPVELYTVFSNKHRELYELYLTGLEKVSQETELRQLYQQYLQAQEP